MDLEKIKSKKTTKELLEFGIINIDKPSGPTSFSISEFVKKKLEKFGVRKTSHFGTLDPKVTGVLPVALNRACKLTGFFIGEDKGYVGIMRIHKEIELERIRKVINKRFTGKIIQKPPIKSRVKRQEREREIKKFEILEEKGKDFLFRVECSGGTYIRKLIHDLGKEIGTGAHMLELRRIRAGIFSEDSKEEKGRSINLYDFKKAIEDYKKRNEKPLRKMIIPAEIISEVYPVAEIKKDNLKQILTGKPVHKKELVKDNKYKKGLVISIFCDNRFIGMYKVTDDKKTGIFAKPEFVMQPLKR